MEDTEYPQSILNLSQKIKSYDEKVDNDVEYSVVSHFDHQLLLQKCIPSSPIYESGIDLDLLCKCIFRPDEWWVNRNLLCDALKSFGRVQGFKPSIKYHTIRCNRYGDKEYKRNYRGAGLHVACLFCLNIKAMYNPIMTSKTTDKSSNRPNWSGPCKNHT